jgi:hypothetical protein
MKINIKLNHQKNGEMNIVTLPADLMKWERITKSKMTDLYEVRRVDGEDQIKVNLGFEDLMAMAWSVLNRTGQTSEKFETWVNDLESIELVGIDEPNPTQAAASDEPSPL